MNPHTLILIGKTVLSVAIIAVGVTGINALARKSLEGEVQKKTDAIKKRMPNQKSAR